MIVSLAAHPKISALLQYLREIPTAAKIGIVAFADFILCLMLVLLAHSLRVSAFVLPQTSVLHLYIAAPLFSVMANAFFQIYWSAARSHSTNTEIRIGLAQVCAALFWVLTLFVVGVTGFARSVVVIYLVFAALGMILLRRFMSEIFTSRPQSDTSRQDPVLIFGAAREGLAALNAIKRHRKFRAVAFVDTDYTLVGRTVAGLRVHAVEELDVVLTKYKPSELILAKAGMTRSGRRTLVDRVAGKGVTVKTIPDQTEFLDYDLKFSELKPILVEDLLGRDPVPPDRKLMEKAVKNQVVMVTGAGGSIGSELVRQAFAYGPQKLILVENSEFALFEVHRALESMLRTGAHNACTLVPLLADVRDADRMLSIMRQHSVDIVFHAAAYKHVRMVQQNAWAGIDNNVSGTLAVAEAALKSKAKRFVLISTDKAVRPTSIMGASKRVAEMIVQALAAEKNHSTVFSMVRFGNVLGSTGSVVPLFREQIAGGGPIKVTHPDVTRYFMLIPEAAQLVIQAGAMAQGGEVFVLEMGEPVKILDLAESMVELAGLQLKTTDNPDGDIEIEFSGLLEGEKLYEELQIGSNVTSTDHHLIRKCNEDFLPKAMLDVEISNLVRGASSLNSTSDRIFTLAGMTNSKMTTPLDKRKNKSLTTEASAG